MATSIQELKQAIASNRANAEKWATLREKATTDFDKGFAFQRSREYYKTVFSLYETLEKELVGCSRER